MTLELTHTTFVVGVSLLMALLFYVLYYVVQIYSAIKWAEMLQHHCQAQLVEMAARVEATHRLLRLMAGEKLTARAEAVEPANADTSE